MSIPDKKEPFCLIHLDDNPFELERFAAALDPEILGEYRLESLDKLEQYRSRMTQAPTPDLVILDIHLDLALKGGVSLVKETREALPSVVILMCSAMDDVATISECLQGGADDFLSKRSDRGEVNLRLRQSYQLARVKRGTSLEQTISEHSRRIPAIAGRTLEKIARRIPLILSSAVSAVHLEGESGTGKEVVADLFAHFLPDATPFVRVNCGAIAPTLLESELFGHVKGAFTGAMSDKKGLLETASGGWIFLDEVATLSPSAQVALLRVLENQELIRVGAVSPRPIQVRVLSAANERISELVRQGKFRKDLWQRLCETEITLAPLRERPEEIEALVRHFSSTMPGGPYHISETALEVLCSIPWRSGNVRELRNCLRAMTELHVNKLLTPLSIPARVWKQVEDPEGVELLPTDEVVRPVIPASPAVRIPEGLVLPWNPTEPISFDFLADQLLLEVLRKLAATRPRLSLREAARCIGMSRSTLSGRLKGLVQKNLVGIEELLPLVGAGSKSKAQSSE